jgi:hypothetical protein
VIAIFIRETSETEDVQRCISSFSVQKNEEKWNKNQNKGENKE